MALHPCPDCQAQISDVAEACPHCGRPMKLKTQAQPQAKPQPASKPDGLTKCPKCKNRMRPIVTSVGGGSCSMGSRIKWTCPFCRRVIHRSGCFIATAAYASEDAVEVQFLREFRDKILLGLPGGKAAVQVYYRTSPAVAAMITRSQLLRSSARRLLNGVVIVIEKCTTLTRSNVRGRMKLGDDETKTKCEESHCSDQQSAGPGSN